jgi:hypothetical protein
MSMPFVQGFGDEIYTGFGVQSDYHGDMSETNLRASDSTIMALHDGLRGMPYQAAVQSNELIGQITRRNIEHARMQSEAGMSIGSRFNATVDQSTATLTIGDTVTA